MTIKLKGKFQILGQAIFFFFMVRGKKSLAITGLNDDGKYGFLQSVSDNWFPML